MASDERGLGARTAEACDTLSVRHVAIGFVVLFVAAVYGLTTLLYCTPNNPLRVYFDEELQSFEKWGYQKWSFFAPPPTSVDRLYCAFSPANGAGETVEILEGVYQRKRDGNPRNARAQVVDYMVSGAASAISRHIREVRRYKKVNELFGGDPEYLNDLAEEALHPDGPYGQQMRTLLRYVSKMAVNEGIELEGLKCQLAFTKTDLPPFSQRYNEEFVREEKLHYKSGLVEVPQLDRH